MTNTQPQPRVYRIIRFRESGTRRTIRNNVTLSEARAALLEECERRLARCPECRRTLYYGRPCR